MKWPEAISEVAGCLLVAFVAWLLFGHPGV